MPKHRTARSYIEEFIQEPNDARLFAESQIGLAVTTAFIRLRKSAKLSQSALAVLVGRRQPYIAKLEGGAYDRCSMPTLRTFARAMGYDLDVAKMIKPLKLQAEAHSMEYDILILDSTLEEAMSNLAAPPLLTHSELQVMAA